MQIRFESSPAHMFDSSASYKIFVKLHIYTYCFLHINVLFSYVSTVFPICLIIHKTEMEGNKTNINYTTLLTKVKVELLERAVKKPKIERTIYPK